MGYTDVKAFREGIPGWSKAGYPLTVVDAYPNVTVPLVRAGDLEHSDSSTVTLIDIRPPSHFQKGHIKGSINLDLEDLHMHYNTIPTDKRVILIDHKGKLTLTTARFLISKNYKNIERLDGGFNSWVKNGLPVER